MLNLKPIQRSAFEWEIPPQGSMRVPVVIYGSQMLVQAMDPKVFEQACNVAKLPGIVGASYAMPDAHWGYGFPIGGVAAFDRTQGGVISAGGVGFDISCGVRTLLTGLQRDEVEPVKPALADALFAAVPAGMGRRGRLTLNADEMEAMLTGGARWAVERGFGRPEDLRRIEEQGRMTGAVPTEVSLQARQRQRDEVGTLGSGNHYLEVQYVAEILAPTIAEGFGIRAGEVVVSIHCGSRGLGHQIGTEFLREMAVTAAEHGISLPDRELACAPIDSPLGRRYLGAMRAGINCAFANRQVITHHAREVFSRLLPAADLRLLYDVSHNTCKEEVHTVGGAQKPLHVHRKGATRAFGPGHPELAEELRPFGQPVIIGGSMGTSSYILAGTEAGEERSLSSSCHGAGRALSRHQALRQWNGRAVVDQLAARGILIRSPSMRGVAEEAPGAYKEVREVVSAADRAGLSRLVARLEPMACIKG